jgi:RHS repeat-associated protein
MISPSCSYRNNSLQPECIGDYRFGFNGMESEGTIYGERNTYDFGARMYDARIGRWFSVDPLGSSTPFLSTFVFCLDNPLRMVDPDGNHHEDVIIKSVEDKGTHIEVQAEVNMKIVVLNVSNKVMNLVDYGDGVKKILHDEFNGPDGKGKRAGIFVESFAYDIAKGKMIPIEKRTDRQIVTTVKYNISVSTVNDYSEIADDENVIVIVNDVIKTMGLKYDPIGLSDQTSATVVQSNNRTEKEMTRTGAHEIAHNMGLLDMYNKLTGQAKYPNSSWLMDIGYGTDITNEESGKAGFEAIRQYMIDVISGGDGKDMKVKENSNRVKNFVEKNSR